MSYSAQGELNPYYKHGMCRTPLYNVWCTMKRRCNSPTDKHFSWYGGRGILVCASWIKFENFRDWALKNGYKHGLTLDRIDNDGNYEPNNCRWATMKQQSNNRRNTVLYEKDGNVKTLSEWAEIFGIRYKQLWEKPQQIKHGIRRVS